MGAISIRSQGGDTQGIGVHFGKFNLNVSDTSDTWSSLPTDKYTGDPENQSITTINVSRNNPNHSVVLETLPLLIETDSAPFQTPNTHTFDLGYYTINSTGADAQTPVTYTQGGLYGEQISTSTARNTIASGDVGITLPFTNATLFTSISYGDIGDNYAYMWVGFFKPPTTGTYTFYTSSDDGSGVWIGDIASDETGRTTSNAVVNNDMGSGHGNQERSGTISLTADTYYPIRIVHEEGTGGSNMTFSWAGPSISKNTDLSQYYYYAGDGSDFASTTTVPPAGLMVEEYEESTTFNHNSNIKVGDIISTNVITVSKEILPNTLPTERLSLNTIDDQSRLVYFDQISIASRKDLISNLPDDGFFNTEKRISVGSFSNLTPYDLNELNKLQSGTRSHTSARIIDSTGAEGEGGGGGGTVTEIQTWY
jgi:hypothetical protein